MKNTLFITQGVIQVFVSIGGLICGVLLMLFPSGRIMQMPLDMLKGSPFQKFFVPGLILFLVNGIGQFTAGVMTFQRHVLAGYVGTVFGMGLMIWIFMQISMIGGGNFLQYGYFFIGVIETALAFLIHESLSGEGKYHG